MRFRRARTRRDLEPPAEMWPLDQRGSEARATVVADPWPAPSWRARGSRERRLVSARGETGSTARPANRSTPCQRFASVKVQLRGGEKRRETADPVP